MGVYSRISILLALAMTLSACLIRNHAALNDVWKYVGKDSHGFFYEYHLSHEAAYKYFETNKKDCVASGWVVCPYIVKGRIILQNDGKYRITSLESNSTFEVKPDTAALMNWKEIDGVVYLSENGVFLFNEIKADYLGN
jgi:hypothetical protein